VLASGRGVLRTEATVSVRLLWAFARGGWTDPHTAEAYARIGIGPAEFVDPATRVPHRLATELLAAYVARTGDASVGLRAGTSVELGDFDALAVAHAARTCATVREAIKCFARYARIFNEAAEVSLVEGANHALWRVRMTDGVRGPPAASDFVLAFSHKLSGLNAGSTESPLEVHLTHSRPTDAQHLAAYEAAFPATTLRFDMAHDGFLLGRAWLDRPMPLRAAPSIQAAFETRSRELAERLRPSTVRQQVLEVVSAQLRTGPLSMKRVASALGMSVATLRRRLEEEGTTFSRVSEEARRELAEVYLRDVRLNISEVAYCLGFAHAPAFTAAFRKWKGLAPSEYRARIGEA